MQDRRGEPGPEDQREQAGLRLGDRRVEDRGEGEEQRDRQIERRARIRSDICVIAIMPPMLKVTSRTSSGTTGLEMRRPNSDHTAISARHVELVGRRLVEHEARQEDAERHRRGRDEGDQLGVDRRRRQRWRSDRAQYAFSVLSSRNGVSSMIFRSNHSDQFSM